MTRPDAPTDTNFRQSLVLAAVALAGLTLTGCGSTTMSGSAPIDFRSASENWTPEPGPATDTYMTKASLEQGEGPAVRPDPAAPLGPDAPERGEAIEILKGDTLYAISERYRVALRALIETNRLSPPYALEVGQPLYLPPPNIHAVEPGETLYSISRRYNVDTRSLAVMNGLPKPWTIYPGQPIRLPALARDSKAKAHTVASGPPVQPVKTKSAPPAKASPKAFTRPLPKHDGFVWPVAGDVVQTFGKSPDGQRSDGVNIAASSGAPFHAAAAGEVVYAGAELAGFGKLLLIRHDGGWVTAYAHAKALLVKEGDVVARGQEVGRIGSTGSVSSPQLHFQLRKGEQAVDPSAHLGALGVS